MTLFLIAIAVVSATLLGGLFALRFKDRVHAILSFSAGAVIGISFFDLLPESLELSEGRYGVATVTGIMALGFLAYMLLNQWFSLHAHTDAEDHDCENPQHAQGALGAGSLSAHSLMDGIAIGLAFQASPAVGAVVAAAVLAHDFSDGINTVGMILRHGGSARQAVPWLAADAAAPALGIALTLLVRVPEAQLALLLSLFTGFFLYIGAADLLPESHHRHSSIATSLMTVLGVGTVFLAVRLAGL